MRIVDLRQELRAGNRSIFSRALQEALRRTLDAGEQAILFLNRRGAATFVLCRDCGYVARCPNCDVPLTLPPPAIVDCRAAWSATAATTGSRPRPLPRLWRAAHPLLWPGHRTGGGCRARAVSRGAPAALGPGHGQRSRPRALSAGFVEHRADVLVGTQMIAKGLDLPLVTLVGVISADTALYLPDYRAAERTFQLLTQVAGRAGRSQRGGQVIVQTYNPDHYAIQAAARHDYAGFYAPGTGPPPPAGLSAL